jgi:hypothetical protein
MRFSAAGRFLSARKGELADVGSGALTGCLPGSYFPRENAETLFPILLHGRPGHSHSLSSVSQRRRHDFPGRKVWQQRRQLDSRSCPQVEPTPGDSYCCGDPARESLALYTRPVIVAWRTTRQIVSSWSMSANPPTLGRFCSLNRSKLR